MPEIKNIIFDLGQVILPIDFSAPVTAFKEIGLDDFDKMYHEAIQSDLFDKLETGKISESEFRDSMRSISGKNWTDQQIDHAWNTIILDFREDTIFMLEKLRNIYNIYLLSNTNSIHFKEYNQQIINRFGSKGLSSYFEKAFYSFEMKLRKPVPEIFYKVIEETGIDVSESLFIDDNKENIDTANKIGFKTIHLNQDRKVEELFGEHLL